MDLVGDIRCSEFHGELVPQCAEVTDAYAKEYEGNCAANRNERLCHACRVSMVLRFIDISSIDSVSIERAAALIDMSTSRLRHLFKQIVGVSFHQYKVQARLKQARQLLATTNLTIEQVVVRLGINDASHFTRDFKRVYGMTPGSARRVKEKLQRK